MHLPDQLTGSIHRKHIYIDMSKYIIIIRPYLYKFKKVCLAVRFCISDPRFIQFALGSCFAVHINAL